MPVRYTRFFPFLREPRGPRNTAYSIYKVLKYRYATALFRKPGTSDGIDPLLGEEEGSKVHDLATPTTG